MSSAEIFTQYAEHQIMNQLGDKRAFVNTLDTHESIQFSYQNDTAYSIHLFVQDILNIAPDKWGRGLLVGWKWLSK